MITAVQIPAAIRACSPVHMETPHGDMVRGIAIRLQPEDGTICARWLIHDAPRRAAHQHTAHLDAIGAEPADFLAALDLARTMMGDKLAPRGLEILRDYALLVVSNG